MKHEARTLPGLFGKVGFRCQVSKADVTHSYQLHTTSLLYYTVPFKVHNSIRANGSLNVRCNMFLMLKIYY